MVFKSFFLIKKDFVKEGVPSQDLIVSGGHMVKLGEDYHLPIYSKLIENIQKESGANNYYHVELEEYDYFLANNLPVESLCTDENEKEKLNYYKERGLEFSELISQ